MSTRETLKRGSKRLRDTSELLAQSAERGLRRALGKRRCIAITGFSGAGKSTLLASLITQLQQLPVQQRQGWFAQVGHCWLSARLKADESTMAAYPYAGQVSRLQAGLWPAATEHLSRALIEVRIKPQSRWRRFNSKGFVSFELEFWDYPGEWLMDLPLARMSYQQWVEDCFTQFNNEPRNALAPELYTALLDIDPHAPFDGEAFDALFDRYRDFLLVCKARGLHILSPGHYAINDKPVAGSLPRFIPLLALARTNELPWQENSWAAQMQARYEQYVQQQVKPFLHQVFDQVDHQLVLVDLLGALGNGKPALEELRRAQARVLQTFHYGHNSWLNRLLAPKVEQLTFVASKLDCVLPAQRQALSELMRALVAESVQVARFESVQVSHLELAAIASTQLVQRAGEAALMVQQGDSAALLKHPPLPRGWPTDNDWQALRNWQPPELLPPSLSDPALAAWPSINLDKLCQQLFGDLIA